MKGSFKGDQETRNMAHTSREPWNFSPKRNEACSLPRRVYFEVQMLCKYLSTFPTLFYGNFVLFYWDFNGNSSRKEDFQILVLKSEEKWWKMSVVVTSFGNKLSARPPILLKPESTTDILIDQDHKFQNSYFKEHL